jgi:DNA-directed RNA polymerase
MDLYSGFEYVQIAVANAYGYDKLTWDKRIEWVDKFNIQELKDCSMIAKEPILFRKAVRALEDAHKKKETGFIMGLDATASGLQMMAVLMGCKKTAARVNLVDTGSREDVYTFIKNKMGADVPRDNIKQAIMTFFYGSLLEPQRVFPDPKELAKLFELLDLYVPGATQCMELMQSCWMKGALVHECTLPDGHKNRVRVFSIEDKKIEVDELDHAVFTHRGKVYQPQDSGLCLAANITHGVDGYVARQMSRRADEQGFDMLSIHDSFWAHPNNMNKVRMNYNEEMAKIAESTLLQDMLREVTGYEGTINKLSTDLGDYVRQANYSLS